MRHKVKLLTGVSSAILFLIGCGDDGIGNGEVGGELSQEEAEELLHEAIEREEELESVSSSFSEEINGGANGEEVSIQIEASTDIASSENIRTDSSIYMDNQKVSGMELVLADGSVFINESGRLV